ncbi:MAG TPA: flagellar biosynthesis protein FlhA [Bryobacteraceae bacterium]|jgi:flagellar biosynthesis protein FlhA|nr:flagellar biosynthesis protein FlhA [Bryobacteraceae bacterium]
MSANTAQMALGVKKRGPRISLQAASEFAVPIAVLGILVALIAPMPRFVLDLLIVADIMMSVIVLMVAMYITRPVEFNVFPTTLLLLTLFRLSLNVSSSRLILLNGHTGPAAAGGVIQAFGNFVVGGNYIIGAVIFLVLIAIQYVVINHGAVRISEVTARFTLDAMPGKQMSIDSDLNAGLIDETEARRRRKQIASEAEFYGAMDGASKFTQRDAVAGILITGINIIAGLLIGVLQHGVDFMKALQTYTVLTIGDGLVTVIPALMISISGGMITTRASSDNRLGVEFQKQVFGQPQPLLLASGILIALATFPGMPTAPFLTFGVGLGTAAWRMKKRAEKSLPEASAGPAKPAKENLDDLLRVEPLSIEVGVSLISFISDGPNSPLLRRIGAIRKQFATELGYIIPAVRVTDNLSLRAREYSICVKGVEVARYELPQGCEMAIAISATEKPPDGRATKDPAFGVPAWWIPSSQAETVRALGYTVIEPLSVMSTHLVELIKRYSHELFSRQEAKKLLDRVSVENAKVVEDLVPKLLPLATVQRVIQNLLRERVSIRDSVTILEALGEAAPATRNPVLLTDYVRQSIRRVVVKPFLNVNGDLPAWFIDQPIERVAEAGIEHGESNSSLALAPNALRDVLDRLGRAVGPLESSTAVITSSACRYFMRQAVESSMPNLFFLSHSEIPAGIKVISLGVVQ